MGACEGGEVSFLMKETGGKMNTTQRKPPPSKSSSFRVGVKGEQMKRKSPYRRMGWLTLGVVSSLCSGSPGYHKRNLR